ncbi:MAG: hypothetical protein KC657_30750, partial [Myxococcales bacterium]|nr:hypothetical protein [Myxococcales bacterium]
SASSSPTRLEHAANTHAHDGRAMSRRRSSRRRGALSRGHVLAVVLGAFALGGVLFACGSDDAPPACEGAACVDGAADATPADGGADGRVDGDGPADAADAGDAADATSACPGPAGTLDPSFGDGGMVWLKYPAGDARGVVVQADGKIVVVGRTAPAGEHFAIVRLMPDGTLDSTFGTNGLVEKRVGTVTHLLAAVALQPDGRIVAAGQVRSTGQPATIAVLRYLADGGADPTFGDAGVVLTSYAGRDAYGRSVALEPTGKIIVAGFSEDAVSPNGSADYEVVRYTADGSMDATFGTGGRVTIDVHGTSDTPGVIALAPGGKIALAGRSKETASLTGRHDVSAVRLDSAGDLDPSFADAGKFVSSFGAPGTQRVSGLAIDGTGRLILGGSYFSGAGTDDFGVFRLTASGVLDLGLADAGLVTTDFSERADTAAGVLLQQDDKIIAFGTSGIGAQSDTYGIAISRYLPNGALDTNFGTGGTVLTPPPANSQTVANAASVDSCGLIVVGGWTYDLGAVARGAMGIARYRR